MGKARPISVIELIKNARNSGRNMKAADLNKYYKLNPQGIVHFSVLFLLT